MFLKKSLACLIILFLFGKSYSQPQKLFWKPPTLKDLQMKEYSEDTSVPAMVLEKHADIYFDQWRDELRLMYRVRKRIKIFKPQGLKYARVEIPYIGYDYFEDFADLRGYIYHLSNGRITRKRLRNKYIQRKQISPYLYVMTMEFPQAQPGDIVEIRYTLATFRFMQPRRWYFQEDIPVRYSEFNANIPYFMKYYFDVYGADVLDEKKAEDAYATLEWSARYRDPIPSGLYYHGYDFRANPTFNFHSTYYHLAMKDVPPFYKEPFLDNPAQYYYHVDMLLYRLDREIGYSSPTARFLWEMFSRRMYQTTEIGYRPMTKERSADNPYPPGYIIFSAENWNSLAKNLRKDPQFGLELRKTPEILPIAYQIKKQTQDSLKMVIAAYNWIRDNIKWNGKYNFLISDRLKNILKTKQGNSADINMLLIALLRGMGIEANPVIIRTVDRGHLIIDLAAFYQFNHTIAAVKVNGHTILLDAIEKDKPWFVLSHNDMNQIGYLIARDTSYFVGLFNPIKDKQEFILTLNQNGTNAGGFIDYKLTGSSRLDTSLYNPYKKLEEVSINKKIFSQQNETQIDQRFEITIPDIIKETDSTLTVYPLRIFKDIKNIFPLYSRSLPIYLGHRKTYSFTVILNFEDSIKTKKLPEINKKVNGAGYKLTVHIYGGKKLLVKLQFDINRYYFDVSEFQRLYELFEGYASLRNTAIVLNKE